VVFRSGLLSHTLPNVVSLGQLLPGPQPTPREFEGSTRLTAQPNVGESAAHAASGTERAFVGDASGGALASGTRARAILSPVLPDGLGSTVDARTLEILEHRRRSAKIRRRGWLVRRTLLLADLLGLSLAFAAAVLLFGSVGPGDHVDLRSEIILFCLSLPGWLLLAKVHGLYERDEERADHTTVDDIVGVFHLVTVGAWVFSVGSWVTGLADPKLPKLVAFWVFAIALVTFGRAVARASCRKSVTYLQNTIIVGAGDVGQLIARKLLQHPEYGINLVGFVDDQPKERRGDLRELTLLGTPEQVPDLVSLLDVERVIIAFSNERDERMMRLVRSLRELDVQIDIVPRLFELVGPKVGVHTVEGLPLLGLPPARLSTSARAIKRAIDISGAVIGLTMTAPLFAVIAWKIKRDSPGPVFFRQTRLGFNMREFTALKFRTMQVNTDDSEHREYMRSIMSSGAALGSNGLYKLDRTSAITPFGRWLRKTSLDELPQLLNILRGDMSLVGPRPCIPYETEHFAPHQFERFLVPAGLTGLWQVTARANSSFGEALEMDVAYVRGWSLGLDLRLLLRTPLQLFRQQVTA
jgi:exopolysaccharide biosynthesis polyprenyl glycosylphosphotransferase